MNLGHGMNLVVKRIIKTASGFILKNFFLQFFSIINSDLITNFTHCHRRSLKILTNKLGIQQNIYPSNRM